MKQYLVLVSWHEESQEGKVHELQEVQPPSTGLDIVVHSHGVHVDKEVSMMVLITFRTLICGPDPRMYPWGLRHTCNHTWPHQPGSRGHWCTYIRDLKCKVLSIVYLIVTDIYKFGIEYTYMERLDEYIRRIFISTYRSALPPRLARG